MYIINTAAYAYNFFITFSEMHKTAVRISNNIFTLCGVSVPIAFTFRVPCSKFTSYFQYAATKV